MPTKLIGRSPQDADHQWLEQFELRHHMSVVDRAHGEAWSNFRSKLPTRARHWRHLAKLRGFTVWSNGLGRLVGEMSHLR